eukprot:CAMPEP_0185030798 /NCGR_PEP_ID=MMETSP1103-20130426/17872_1 /TAXON_ID=36769 /ORGANISM="Paraphysomonas bandaiensis, Strain Caron Lab Isolate" /LENGTH=413 /DNA_ID=CAMNT_0027566057 /DNA_START=158 /DNA_END=1399 /DNA_ORIENTATION=+
MILGRNQEALELMHSLFLTKCDLDTLFTAFTDIDADGRNAIRYDEFLAYFRIESTKFNDAVFNFCDDSQCGHLNFLEFVVAMWNFLTIDHSQIGSFAFLLFDTDETGQLDSEEVLNMIYVIHNNTHIKSKAVGHVIDKLKSSKESFSLENFDHWSRTHMSLLEPVLLLQKKLRQNIISERYWLSLSNRRYEHCEFGDIKYIWQLKKTVSRITHTHMKELYRKKIEARRNLDANALSAKKGRAKRTTSMLRFFRLIDKGINSKGKSTHNALKKKILGGPKAQSGEFDDVNEQASSCLDTKKTWHDSSPLRTNNTEDVKLGDVVDLPIKRRKRKSSIFKPNLKRRDNRRKGQKLKNQLKSKGKCKTVIPSRNQDRGGMETKHTLPPGWVECKDNDGESYYYNEETQMTTWNFPRE